MRVRPACLPLSVMKYRVNASCSAPKSPGAKDYGKLALEVIQRVEENGIARHAEDAA